MCKEALSREHYLSLGEAPAVIELDQMRAADGSASIS